MGLGSVRSSSSNADQARGFREPDIRKLFRSWTNEKAVEQLLLAGCGR